VRVSNNGTDWVTVWANGAEIADTSWVHQEIDISAVADNQPTVYLRWTMGSTDGGWRYCGWNIDDIELTAGVCSTTPGDYNGDGSVDEIDLAQFGVCFSGPGGGVGPGCGVFDFDADDDIDCDDWALFKIMWTGGGSPTFEPCEAFAAPTADPDLRNRYVSFTAGPSQGMPQAFRVTTVSNPRFPYMVGDQKWVTAPDEHGTSRLVCDPPVYRDWAMAHVDIGDKDTVPGATYAIEATLDGVDFLAPVSLLTVPVWGDVVGEFVGESWTGPDNVVDFKDITAVVDRFKNDPTAPPVIWCDMQPALPDGVIDFADISNVVDAFQGDPYPLEGPTPCE
jgi:hypothetical protein